MIQKVKNIIHMRQALKAAKKYGNPEQFLKIIGVTGTDGKTSTVAMIYHILQKNGIKAGYISTTAAKVGGKELDTGYHVTSPDPWELPRFLRMMVENNVEIAILETTSQGLHQNRFGRIKFDAAVITNIKDDHLDYHKNWENYAKSKFKLLQNLKNESVAVLNANDKKSADWLRKRSSELKQNIYVNWANTANLKNIKFDFNNLSFTYKNIDFKLPIFGANHNLENALQAVILSESLLPLTKIASALSSFQLPEGRMQAMIVDPIRVIVDFAHTPASLEHSLKALKNVLPKSKRLITVFGCAGKRDKGRRQMGGVSANYSDITVLTAEDPRNEKLSQINNDIFATAKKHGAEVIQRFQNHDDYSLTGLGELHAILETTWKANQKPFILFDEDNKNSRRDAIELAIRLARRGDCVYITGKGHEKSLAFGREEKEYDWSDQKEVQRALKKLKITQ